MRWVGQDRVRTLYVTPYFQIYRPAYNACAFSICGSGQPSRMSYG